MSDSNIEFRAGFVALIGRPNVGKSTLLNRFVEQKISIVSRKPQTTRQRVLGIKTTSNAQLVFIDTPGLHGGQRKEINRQMNRAAAGAALDADLVLWVVEAPRWQDGDDFVLQRLADSPHPVGIVVNKIDRVKPRDRLLPYLQEIAAKRDFAFVTPVSASSGENIERLEQVVTAHLPVSPPLFPADQVTDLPQRLWAAEIIREKLLEVLREELPHAVAVEVESWQEEGKLLKVSAVIWVERDSQKAIVIGRKGSVLKSAGQAARLDLERELDQKVFLELWVKVKSGWTDDARRLRELGLGGE
ncbi:MAG TPA: GTPase Era [Gammaproteobacteria bacterium]|nr:GTPase Era [Gammaproteobacteria bacterium]